MYLFGKDVKDSILNTLEVKQNKKLAIINIGSNKESLIYINTKKKLLDKYNIETNLILLDKTTNEELIDIITRLNNDPTVTGIMIEHPLPSYLDKELIINTISYDKDIEGITNKSLENLRLNKPNYISPTALAVLEILKYYNVELDNKNIVLVGKSNLVGKQILYMLNNMNYEVTVCDSKTTNLASITKNADILITSVGKPHLITRDMIKKGSTIIDIGTTKIEDKLLGDVEDVSDIANITPVPLGVGQVVSTMLLKNLCKK